MKIKILKIDPSQAADLIRELDAYQAALYPAESNHLDSIETLRSPNVQMFAAFIEDRVCAIGAVKVFDTYGEIKRVYVPERYRGQGLAKKIMAVLENALKDASVNFARLETGIHQPEAIGLYMALGYKKCGPFGDYAPDPLSVFMEKEL